MKNCKYIIFLIFLLWLVNCHPNKRRRRIGTIQKFHRKTGEAIVVDYLIQKYEKEHQKFYLEEAKHGALLEWPTLNNKNLSNYCRKYLQHSVPSLKTYGAIGNQIYVILYYEKENTNIKNKIVTVHCKLKKKHPLSYYITRAPEPNCVYSLTCTNPKKRGYIFTIICKHCNFEDKQLIDNSLKRKMEEITSEIHRSTGQPIAYDEYLLKYEEEHQEMLRKEEGRNIEWSRARKYLNLDNYCYQYLGECAPGRQRDGTRGKWKFEKLHYQKLHISKDVILKIIICMPPNTSHLQYYITRAPEPNCAYALIRQVPNHHGPFVIVFKHCAFDDKDDGEAIAQANIISDKNVMSKLEMKEEKFDTLKPLQLLPEN